MSINLPHRFPSLIEGESRPALIIGSGPSYELVPNINELFPDSCRKAEEKLGFYSGIDFNEPNDDDLYSWAELIIAELERNGQDVPKLRMADALEILDDLSWQPQVKRRALQTLARHRVLARFARERRWRTIWSLNWDSYLEVAFESIGINPDTDSASNILPWINKYRTFITEEDYAPDDVLKVYKPHGCVRSLISAKKAHKNGDPDGSAESLSDRFLITRSEMASVADRISNQDYNFYADIRNNFSGHSLYTLGWKADVEGYLLDVLEGISAQLKTDHDDSLCIINRSFYEGGGHGRLRVVYDRTEAQCFIHIKDFQTLDDFFLWLHAFYCINKLINWADTEEEKTEIQRIVDNFHPPAPDTQRIIYDWADCFLPAWMRLCWRAGLVACSDMNDQLIEPHNIRIDAPDEHIPLALRPNPPTRADLSSSIPILLSIITGDENLDLRTYPGSIYRDVIKLL